MYEDEVVIEENGAELTKELMAELVGNPDLAVEFVRTISKITKPWEAIGNNGTIVNEAPTSRGEAKSEFFGRVSGVYVSGYRLQTIFGDEVATIIRDTPKWKIVIDGKGQVDAPFIEHGQKAESIAKEFTERKLRELGYVIGT